MTKYIILILLTSCVTTKHRIESYATDKSGYTLACHGQPKVYCEHTYVMGKRSTGAICTEIK